MPQVSLKSIQGMGSASWYSIRTELEVQLAAPAFDVFSLVALTCVVAVCNDSEGLRMADIGTVDSEGRIISEWKLIPVPMTKEVSILDKITTDDAEKPQWVPGLFFVCSRHDSRALSHTPDAGQEVALVGFDPACHGQMWYVGEVEPDPEEAGVDGDDGSVVLNFFSNMEDLTTTVYAFAKSLYVVKSSDGRYLRIEEGWKTCVAAATAPTLDCVFAVTSCGVLPSTGNIWVS